MSGWSRVHWAIGSALGLGRVPFASGTVASAAAAALWYGVYPSAGAQWLAVGIAVLAGTWAAGALARELREEDPSCCVIDEVAGMWLALAGLPRDVTVLSIAFLLFRALDIIKVPPLRQLERLPGGIGIMADDVAAGLVVRFVMAVGLAQGPG